MQILTEVLFHIVISSTAGKIIILTINLSLWYEVSLQMLFHLNTVAIIIICSTFYLKYNQYCRWLPNNRLSFFLMLSRSFM